MSFQPQSEIHKKRSRRNAAVALCLVGFIFLVATLSLVKLRNAGAQEGFDHAVRPSVTEAAEQ